MLNSFWQFWLPHKFARYLGLAIATFSLTGLLTLVSCSPQQGNPQTQQTTSSALKLEAINIGHQNGTPGLNLLKARGLLEKRLASEGTKVNWVEFRGVPPMMEAMAAGSVDIGGVGNLPPIFAQAGDNPIVYVAATTSNARSQAIIVPKDSSIKTLADLKGKKVAVQKGTALHYLVLKALEKSGLTLDDIKPAYLTIPDSISAFESNSLDALPVSDPYYAKKELSGEVRVLVTGDEVAPQRAFYIATRSFAEKHPDSVKLVLEELQNAETWAKANPDEVAKLLSEQTKYKPEIWESIFKNRPPFSGVFEVKDEYIAEQQQVADLFYKEKLIPKVIQIKEAVWRP